MQLSTVNVAPDLAAIAKITPIFIQETQHVKRKREISAQNREIKTAKCLFSSEIVKCSSAKFSRYTVLKGMGKF